MIEEQKKYALSVVVPGLNKILHYNDSLELEQTKSGHEVIVEVSRTKRKGWVVEKVALSEIDSKIKLKNIIASEAVFPPSLLPLFNWMSEYYGVSLSEVIDNAVPKKVSAKKETFISLRREILEEDFLQKKKAKLQSKILEKLVKEQKDLGLGEIKVLGKSTNNALKALEKAGFIKIYKKEAELSFENRFNNAPPDYDLNQEQILALEKIDRAISQKSFSPLLLQGVTGSGKTEVYIQAVKKVLREGKTALIIVPEIALTPQLIERFEKRLNHKLAILHSQLGIKKRWQSWHGLLSGKLQVALGARSSIFAPVDNLGLIVVDEEHDSSFKQSDGFRYHARDVAVMRAKFANCPIILGSATPSFESLNNVKNGRYDLARLKERANKLALPEISLVDLRKIKRKEMSSKNISPQLHAALAETLSENSQSIVLYNRRGFASYLQCADCAEVINCLNCSVSLTYHQKRARLVCHYCGKDELPPKLCPICHNPKTTRIEKEDSQKVAGELEERGAGTESVCQELETLFPKARILRMDSDTIENLSSYEKILWAMRERQADILVGTQMIAKGHDLPGVKLVGVIDADVALHFPDFRASEKTFQLLVQASGRAGRDKERGRVILQTREPNHPSILAASTNRFEDFVEYELKFRKALSYPPYAKLLRLIISSTDLQDAYAAADLVKKAALEIIKKQEALGQKISLLGPAPAPLQRLQNRYRWHIILKAQSSKAISSLAKALNEWKRGVKGVRDFRLSVDVDAVDML